MEIYLIRHTSVQVPPGVCYGQTDVPLQPTFTTEAAATLHELQRYMPFDKVYTSPLSRCTRLAAYCGYPDAQRDKRLLEMDFGAWEMVPYDDNDDPHLFDWYKDYLHVQATGGESFDMQYRRVSRFLDEVRLKPYRRVAVFTHGGVLAAARIYAGVLPYEEGFTALTRYGGIEHITL
ncbi:MAG: alpha-ribazole phosphatase [Prevotellaceae bacterium]|nr:alpha-ribazole phosphatase [Prevotellaceae bacterium]